MNIDRDKRLWRLTEGDRPLWYLTEEEAEVASLVADRTKMDCWFYAEPAGGKWYAVHDLEFGGMFEQLPAVIALEYMAEGLDCRENYENCNLSPEEDEIFRKTYTRRMMDLPSGIREHDDWVSEHEREV